MHENIILRQCVAAGKVLFGISVLFLIYFVGAWCVQWINFPIPGPVFGMLLIFLMLQCKLIQLDWVQPGAQWLLTYLGLFYVPYGVGIINSGDLLAGWGWQITILVVATVLTVFILTGKIYHFLTLKSSQDHE
ncbi:MAG TPA: CidA/LrgA family protein [Membranihabitans sp.]|nr:CidA/LrgA family protein [Membranihabitans sp.]